MPRSEEEFENMFFFNCCDQNLVEMIRFVFGTHKPGCKTPLALK